MNFHKESKITITMSGNEYDDLCSLIDNGRYYLEDFLLKDLKEDSQDKHLADSKKRLIEISKLYTNFRARL